MQSVQSAEGVEDGRRTGGDNEGVAVEPPPVLGMHSVPGSRAFAAGRGRQACDRCHLRLCADHRAVPSRCVTQRACRRAFVEPDQSSWNGGWVRAADVSRQPRRYDRPAHCAEQTHGSDRPSLEQLQTQRAREVTCAVRRGCLRLPALAPAVLRPHRPGIGRGVRWPPDGRSCSQQQSQIMPE